MRSDLEALVELLPRRNARLLSRWRTEVERQIGDYETALWFAGAVNLMLSSARYRGLTTDGVLTVTDTSCYYLSKGARDRVPLESLLMVETKLTDAPITEYTTARASRFWPVVLVVDTGTSRRVHAFGLTSKADQEAVSHHCRSALHGWQ